MDPTASYTAFPVCDVKLRQEAAINNPATAAPSSTKTATALGSRPRTTSEGINISVKYV